MSLYYASPNSHYEKFSDGTVKCIDDEIPFEIPESWEWCRLKHIFSMQAGKNISASEISQEKSESNKYPCYGGNGLRGYVADYNTNGSYLIVGRQGALCGNIKMASGKFYATEHAVLTDNYSVTDINWGYHFLTALNLNQYATATAQPGLAVSNIVEVLIPLPPIEEQKRIAKCLTQAELSICKYDVAQDKLERLNIDIYKNLKKSILQEAIQGKLVPQLAEEGDASELLKQIEQEKQKLVKEGKLKKKDLVSSTIYRGDDNRYYEKVNGKIECIDEEIPFEIPDSWSWVRLKTIFNIWSARRVHEKDWRKTGIPFYRAREVGTLAEKGKVDNDLFIEEQLYDEFAVSGLPHRGDLLVTAVGTLGKVYVVPNDEKFYFKDGSVLCLQNCGNINPMFLKMAIESNAFKNQYEKESQGTTVATLTIIRVKEYLLPIPPRKEQDRIVNKMHAIINSL